ncbi:hypothetical protein [Pseudomonas sp. HMWF006]|uniref:hypothetical protein n=1 Tax=Pseudomonas sp. HMWF006 TaxID=2056843 RepID=UPI000D457A25|nr:hypothetical protein [Pseudomonas sp. HMWF006]PTT05112.1 hypothetical protein DBR24_01950 [Pseudomonas sp. HMWF006]PTT74134.1 hypothetical protein DBR26_01275 [Pseudomonas sp. HMWF007]PTT94944.1 hypothetical protein DBR29_01865 [Pseudomonas sp. HMWF005]
MANPHLVTTDPADYRFAVHCCSYKWELTDKPDRAVALFADSAAAGRFGHSMWPSTYEVIDRITGERVCA